MMESPQAVATRHVSPSRRETIFALASGVGRAAIAVVRISGPQADQALGALLRGPLPPDRLASLRLLRHPATGEALDRGLVVRFMSPRSFTGEAMCELQVTGGRAVQAAIIEALSGMPGLRPAEPGEFALRAFENGKLDLAQVEGLADLVEAQTEAQRQQALRIAGGALSRKCEAIRAEILAAMAMVEAEIDFSDQDDVGDGALRAAQDHIALAASHLSQALAGAQAGERLREGFCVVIAGPPNVGKSTLLNAIAQRDVAIVSDIPGTTRDLLEISLDLRGFPVILVDTAGLRDSADPIEREGVARARRRIGEADLTLWLTSSEACELPLSDRPRGLTVQTKFDLAAAGSPCETRLADVAVSAITGFGMEKLLDAIAKWAERGLTAAEPALIAHARHRVAFSDALQALRRAQGAPVESPELMAEDLRLAARALDRVAGRIDVEDILGHIFQRLCIGK